jgi:hypothetical protein
MDSTQSDRLDEMSLSDDKLLDDVDLVMVAPGRPGTVLVRTEFPRTIRLCPSDARELARRLQRAAEVAAG